MLRLMFSISTVASSTRIPTASARPPSVMMLMVSPKALRTMIEVNMESGIDTAIMTVLRQLPKKTKIMKPVRHAAISASRTTPSIEARTNNDCIDYVDGSQSFGLQRVCIEVDLNLELLPPVRPGNCATGNCHQARADEVDTVIK